MNQQRMRQRVLSLAIAIFFSFGISGCEFAAALVKEFTGIRIGPKPAPVIKSVSTDPCVPKEPVGRIHFDCQLSTEGYETIKSDLLYLQNMTFFEGKHARELQGLLHLPPLSGEVLFEWLQDRIQFILTESFKDQKEKEYFASNLSNAYLSQFQGPFAVIEVPGYGPVEINSQGVGIVLLNAPFFRDYGLHAGTIDRLSTLLHEARHNDGTGDSLGFHHKDCPTWHSLAGKQYYCDPCTNGAYRIGSVFIRAAAENCWDCSPIEKTRLFSFGESDSTRVLPDAIECEDRWQFL